METERTVIVTGANGGLGRALCEAQAREGYRVIMACRNREKSETVRKQIAERTGNGRIELLPLDLSSMGSIRRFADTLALRNEKVSVLLNNAGAMSREFRLTENGLEWTMGVNFMGTAALTLALIPLMEAGGRIINTSSCTYRLGKLKEEPLRPRSAGYRRMQAYADSKIALMLFTLELARRLRESRIAVFAADPGVADTGIITMHRWYDPLADLFFRPFISSPEKAVRTALWLASPNGPGTDDTTVFYGGNCKARHPKSLENHPMRQPLWQEMQRWLASCKEYQGTSPHAADTLSS